MKKSITFLLLLTTVIFSYGQKESTREIFEKDIKEFLEATNKKDWDKINGIMYPRTFEFFSKQKMITIMDLPEKMGMSIDRNYIKVDSISDIVNSGKEKFYMIYYSFICEVIISDSLKLASIDRVKGLFKRVYGEENVSYNDEENLFTFNSQSRMIAIAYKKSSDWKYILCWSFLKEVIPKLIPKIVQKKFKL
jgi:hypothetical protein